MSITFIKKWGGHRVGTHMPCPDPAFARSMVEQGYAVENVEAKQVERAPQTKELKTAPRTKARTNEPRA